MTKQTKFKKISKLLLCLMFTLLLFFFVRPIAFSAEPWQGVDESVVGKFAKEHGREAMKPLINTDQGDLLLFVFLIAGTVGGFTAGYYWKVLMTEKEPKIGKDEQKING